MSTEFATGFATGSHGDEAGRGAAERARSELSGGDADFVVAFCSPAYDPDAVVDGVRSVTGDADLVGATAEGEFTERGVHTSFFTDRTGVTVALVAGDDLRFFTGLGRNVSEDAAESVARAAADLPTAVEGYPHLGGLLLSSALSGGEELALSAYQEVPVQWAGGGASDLRFEDATVFVGEETATDGVALALVASKRPLAVGVGNRHSPVGEPVEVTHSEGTVVHELDGEPAYRVWRRIFREVARDQYGIDLGSVADDPERLFQLFTELAFGIRTGDDEYKVRAPYPTAFFEPYADSASGVVDSGGLLSETPSMGTLSEGALSFAHPIPEGVVLYPMTSGADETIDRGARSARHALADMDDGVAGGLVFDCPCGEITLREDYHELVAAVADPVDAPIAGIQSGSDEVCFRRDDMRGAHETATSLLLFPEGDG